MEDDLNHLTLRILMHLMLMMQQMMIVFWTMLL